MAYALAGRYNGVVDALSGVPQGGASVYIYPVATPTVLAVTYTDKNKGTTSANPVIADSYGNYSVWLAPGDYNFVVNGYSVTDSVRADPTAHPRRSPRSPVVPER